MYKKLLARRQELQGKEGGFTLIELLVVVVIIGILVAIAIPLYLHFENGAHTSAAQSDVNGLTSTIKLCENDNGGVLPTAATGGDTAGGTVVFTGAGTTNPCASDTFTLSGGDTAVYTPGTGTFTIAVTNASSNKTATFDSSTGQTTTTG